MQTEYLLASTYFNLNLMKRKRKLNPSNTTTDTTKSCPSCGNTGHQRSSSLKCPNRRVRPGKEKQKSNDPDYWIQRKYFVYKQGLKTFCREEQLEEAVQIQVRHITSNAFYATRLLNYHLQCLVETQSDFPDMTSPNCLR